MTGLMLGSIQHVKCFDKGENMNLEKVKNVMKGYTEYMYRK